MNQKDIYQDLYRAADGIKDCWTVETVDGHFIHFFNPINALAFYLTGNPELEKHGVHYEN